MRLRNYLNKEKLRREGYFKEIINCVSKHMEIDKNKIKTSSGRKREYVQARNMVCSILSGNESITLSKIAETVGYTNHSSVIHAIKMHEIDMGLYKKYASMYNGVINELSDPKEENDIESIIKRITILEEKIVDLQKCLTK